MSTVPDLVRGNAARRPGAPCVVGDDRAFTFAECDERATRFAAALEARGVRPGDRVAMLAYNEPEFLELEVGCQRLGAVLVPLNYRLAVAELEQLVADCGVSLLVHGPGLAEAAAALDIRPTLFLGADGFGESYERALSAQASATWDGDLDADAPATILYTSGTTGRPKGATVTNGSQFARVVAFDSQTRCRESDVFLSTLPMFHIASALANQYTYYGAAVHIMRTSTPEAVVERIAGSGVTHTNIVPTVLNAIGRIPGIDRTPFASLQTVIYGASPIAPSVLERSIDLFGCGFLQLYGMTETCACVSLEPADHSLTENTHRLASAGRDIRGFRTRIVDLDDRDTAPGEVGEIIVRGPGVMSGYWGRPEETSVALRGGWMHTGDLGTRDADGFTYVVDRLKDMIITGGENVYPREVEDVAQRHPDVMSVAVIGVPDERWGERVHAVVCRRDGSELSADELLGFVRGSLAGYKTPKTVEFRDQLPVTATGKIDKKVLRGQLPERTALDAPL